MPAGRPTLMTDETLKKLEEAFALGCTDSEACFYADISHQTLYNYQEKHPEFVERKEALKQRPILQARQTVIANLKSDVKNAQWFLERKAKNEFSAKQEVEISTDYKTTKDKIGAFLDDLGDGEDTESTLDKGTE